MKKNRPAMPPIVEIFWEDHYSLGDDWFDQTHKHELLILSAIGYLVAEDDKYYYVACTYEIDTGKYSAGTAVLKNCVVKFRYCLPQETATASNVSSIQVKKIPARKKVSNANKSTGRKTPTKSTQGNNR